MRKSAYEIISPRIEKCLSEKDRPQTVKEIAEGLGVTTSSIHSVVQLMEVFKVVQKVKRMGRYRYFLKGVYDDEQLSAMFPPKIVKRIPKRRKSPPHSTRSPKSQVKESFLEEHLADMRLRASSGEGPSALAMIGLNQIEVVEDDVDQAAKVMFRHLDVDIEAEERPFETPKKIEPFATVEHLPKNARKLNLMQTKNLKEQLKGLEGYDRIERFKTAFADFSALKNRSYGNVFYFSMTTNPWENVYRVTVDDTLPLLLPLSGSSFSRKWSIMGSYLLESGHCLVEIDVEGRRSNYVQSQLKRRIEQRRLKIVSSSSRGSVYLERKL